MMIIMKKNKGKNNLEGIKGMETPPNPASFSLNKIPTNKFQNANHIVHFITRE
tara:strand:+ start:261 stop:419 length:159 start_codon:yes stop_codon:yes gene_type:complete